MTQHQDDASAAGGPAAEKVSAPGEGTGAASEAASEEASDTFTLAGPGSDPAAPAVQPAARPDGQSVTGTSHPGSSAAASATPGLSAAGSSADGSSIGGLPAAPSGDYDKYGVPTMDFVRDKIEARYAASLGAEELARQTQEAKSFEQRAEERAKAAEAALDAIRKSLRDNRQS